MHSIEIPKLNIKMELPSEVSELTPGQFRSFVHYHLLLKIGKLSYEQFRIALLNAFVEFKEPLKKLSRQEKDNVYSEIYRLSELMNSFFTVIKENGEDKTEINISFIRNLIPVIFTPAGPLHGPADGLTDISFFEYIDAHNHYIDYINSASEESLNSLVAVLYRPQIPDYENASLQEDFDGSRRVKYNPNVVELRSRDIGKLPFVERYGIFLYFHGCEQFLRNGEIPLGGNTIRFSTLYESSPGQSGDDTGLVGVLYTLAESHVFGNVKETANANLYDVMVRLYQLMKTYKNLKTSEES